MLEGKIPTLDLQKHWNKAYSNNPQESLGWFEKDLSPSLELIKECNLTKDATILVVGSGSTTLIDSLIENDYTSIIANDISDKALDNLSKRMQNNASVQFIADDLANPDKLKEIELVELWVDRAVLHFLIEEKDQAEYFKLLKSKVKNGGYVLLAEFALDGAKKCSGLPVVNYSVDMFNERLGKDFELLNSFDYLYTMPSGDLRPYIYTLYKRK